MNDSRKIMLIEDDASMRSAIEAFLKKLNYQVVVFSEASLAISSIDESVHLILSDVMMPGLTGYELLKYVRKNFPDLPVILITAFGTIEKAVEAMKNGAYDFIVKPFNLHLLETAINSVFLDKAALDQHASDHKAGSVLTRLQSRKASEGFISQNPKMLEMVENLKSFASSKATVLIQGESGTGKEVIAKMIHEFSPRANRIFVAINCAAMPDSLLESELFGHEKGSFTGACNRQIGKFEVSNNGTILLDEISEMSLAMQTKLLRVLQECEIYRVGGVKPIPLNLRVIATTNRDLYQYMKAGNFREDLFYRINVIPVVVAPLRERSDDIVLLAKEFIDEFSLLHARKPLELDDAVNKKLLRAPWYGNVRELRNAMERAVLVGDFDILDEVSETSAVLSAGMISDYPASGDGSVTLSEIERRVIITTLTQCAGNKTKTAHKLGISLRTLRNKLKSYGVSSEA